MKGTTTNAFREENERERKERRESEREKERKERLLLRCDETVFSCAFVVLRESILFGVGGKGHVTNILIKTRARTLFSTALKRARKRTEKAARERTPRRQH